MNNFCPSMTISVIPDRDGTPRKSFRSVSSRIKQDAAKVGGVTSTSNSNNLSVRELYLCNHFHSSHSSAEEAGWCLQKQLLSSSRQRSRSRKDLLALRYVMKAHPYFFPHISSYLYLCIIS